MSLRLFIMRLGENKWPHPSQPMEIADDPSSTLASSPLRYFSSNEASFEVAVAKREAIERWENEGGEVLHSNHDMQPTEAARAAEARA